jgi:hypothetical protein
MYPTTTISVGGTEYRGSIDWPLSWGNTNYNMRLPYKGITSSAYSGGNLYTTSINKDKISIYLFNTGFYSFTDNARQPIIGWGIITAE